MAKFHIEITMDNAAFAQDRDAEIARILTCAARRIENNGNLDFSLVDANGNTCGRAQASGARKPRRVHGLAQINGMVMAKFDR